MKRARRSSRLAQKKRKRDPQDEELGMFLYHNVGPSDEDITDWNQWVAATSTRNYMLDDGILDVLSNKGSVLTKTKPEYVNDFVQTIGKTGEGFVASVMTQGIKFEERVISWIIDKFGKNRVKNIGGDFNSRSKIKYLETINAMKKKKYPIIYQGVVRNYENQTYGVPDLLIRGDFLSKIIDKDPLPELKSLKRKYRKKYYVVDIKFKTLNLKSDSIHLRNDGVFKAYKSQLCIYNSALKGMQGYEPPYSFILGWKWKYTFQTVEHKGFSCFDRIGRIDYSCEDKIYIEKTEEAVKWVRKVRNESNSWDLSESPLPHPLLYPNMCNRYDYPYHRIKKKFANDIDEITLLWRCGTKHRKIAHKNGVYSWKDPNCNVNTLGFSGEKTPRIVSQILKVNQDDNTDLIIPKYITNDFGGWQDCSKIDLFVDFEMTCSVLTDFKDITNSTSESLIFMIGVGYIDPKTSHWLYKDFTVERLDREHENYICHNFYSYIKSIMEKYEIRNMADIPMYHWSHAEPSAWKRAKNRYLPKSLLWEGIVWIDALKIFQLEPIAVKGCMNYSLKTIAKAFHNHGFIETVWEDGTSCSDGADAALGAYQVDQRVRRFHSRFDKDPLIREIIKYNEVDCKVVQEIIYYLRENHIEKYNIMTDSEIIDYILESSVNSSDEISNDEISNEEEYPYTKTKRSRRKRNREIIDYILESDESSVNIDDDSDWCPSEEY